jgi:membrane protease YdiL (CAAX protease family)
VCALVLPVVKYLQITGRPGAPSSFDWWALARQAVLLLLVASACLTTVPGASPRRLGRILFTRLPAPERRDRLRLLWWTVVPGSVIALGFALYVAGPGRAEVDAGRIAELVVITVIGEEVLFRGLLPVLALGTPAERAGFVGPSLAFGLWHVPDALSKGLDAAAMLNAGLVFAGTALAAWAILLPLRLQSRSLLGPMLVHGATNGGFILLGLSSFS